MAHILFRIIRIMIPHTAFDNKKCIRNLQMWFYTQNGLSAAYFWVCAAWNFYSGFKLWAGKFALFYGGSFPPSAVLPAVALNFDSTCVAAFGGAPYGRSKYWSNAKHRRRRPHILDQNLTRPKGAPPKAVMNPRRIKRISQPKVRTQNKNFKQRKIKNTRPIGHFVYRITFVNS